MEIGYQYDYDELNTALCAYYHEEVQLSRDETKEYMEDVMATMEQILAYINKEDPRFSKQPVRVGSYWQGLKVNKADEFDFNVPLDKLGQYYWVPRTTKPREYGFNNKLEADETTSARQDLEVVYTPGIYLPPEPVGYRFMCHNNKEPIWRNSMDLTRHGQDQEWDIVPFLVRRRFNELLTQAIRDLDLRGQVRQVRGAHGPALTIKLTTRKGKEVSVDFSPTIPANASFEGSPVDWPRPSALWPDREKVEKIKAVGLSTVAKKDFYWLITFANLEKELVSKVDEDGGCRKKSHRIMKKMNEDVWCNTPKAAVSSYVLKNIWFLELEKYPDGQAWIQDKLSERVISMTRTLLQAIRQRVQPQYFYSVVNLLGGKDEAQLRELDVAAEKITSFLHNPSPGTVEQDIATQNVQN